MTAIDDRKQLMKATRILYWVSTTVFALIFTTTGALYVTHSPIMVAKLDNLGYPPYVLNMLGVAKLLGAAALITPRFLRIKEWAYAGFVFDFVGATWSHAVVQGATKAVPPLLPLAVLLISYISYRKLQSNPQTAVVAPSTV
jgi:hypothetical protein